jgi:hypothetical protein
VCLPFRNPVCTVHRKNWLPLVLGPALAIDRMPGPACQGLAYVARHVIGRHRVWQILLATS